MNEIRFTLIGDGSSDKALIYIIKWLVDDLYPTMPSYVTYADFRGLPKPPLKKNVGAQISTAKEYYPYDILVYHRDAESNDLQIIDVRKSEVFKEVDEEEKNTIVCVVPIKMMESWLLINKEALKKAAGNRNYKGNLSMPSINKIEAIPQPKELLHHLLITASGLKGRNLNKFNQHQAVHWLAEYIDDFSMLRELQAFRIFEHDFKTKVDEIFGINLI
jgi:hypothetical protein